MFKHLGQDTRASYEAGRKILFYQQKPRTLVRGEFTNTGGTKPYTLQRINGLIEFFIREEEIHLHFSHEYIDCKFYIFSKEGAATISWEDKDLQQNPRLVKKVLMPILDALKQAGFGHFDIDEPPEDKLSKEAIAFLQKPSSVYF